MLRRLDAAADCVQRREQLVLHIHIAARHLVQQCRFARVGVADQRDDGDFVLLAALAAQFALLLHRIQAAAEFRHALADVAAVHFQLRFARPARADAARQPRQHQALPNQAAGLVLQLRQFDLQLALGGRCALGENVQDQRRAVNHLHAQNLLQIARLNARQFLVKNAQISFQCLTLPAQFIRAPAPDEQRRIRLILLLQELPHDLRPGGVRQARQLIQRFQALNAHQHGAFLDMRALLIRLPADNAVTLGDLPHPVAIGRLVPADGLVHQQILLLHQKRALHKRRLALQAADGDHCVIAERPQRRQIHIGEASVAIGVGVDAADAAQALGVAAQAVVAQLHVPISADGHVHHFAVARDVHRDFPVQHARKARQHLHQLAREERVLIHLIIV